MKNLQIGYLKEESVLYELETGRVIMSTNIPQEFALLIDYDSMNPILMNNVVKLWNKTGDPDCLGQGELDEYLMNSELCEQEEREIIVEALFDFYHINENHLDFAKFEEWMNGLPTQTLTDELKREILEEAVKLIDM